MDSKKNDNKIDNNDKKTTNIKKKRGRKPKISVNKNLSTNNDIEENFVIQLKLSDLNINNDININNFDINELKNEEINQNLNSEVCWNCCHDFVDLKYNIPLKYINNIFYIYGEFCSFECSLRYGYEYLNNYNIHELYSLINLYSKKLFNKDYNIKMAPSKLCLKLFGGNLTIHEYRNSFIKNKIHDIQLQPIIPINNHIDKYELNDKNINNNLKLYRTKKLVNENKNIKNTMDLKINNNINNN